MISNVSFQITEEIVARYEQKIERKKKAPKLERLLQDIPETLQFASPNVYKRFLNLIKKVPDELYTKALRVFRSRLGLPVDCFEEDIALIAADRQTGVGFSKLLLEKTSPLFTVLLTHHIKQTKSPSDRVEVVLPLSITSLQTYKNYFHTGKIDPLAESSDVDELLNFARLSLDEPFIDEMSKTALRFHLDKAQSADFEPEPSFERAKEFTKSYLEQMGIKSKRLRRGSFAIPLTSFYELFSQKESTILSLLARGIDSIWLDVNDCRPLLLLPGKYRRAIISLSPAPGSKPNALGVEGLSPTQQKDLYDIFPNMMINYRIQDELERDLSQEPAKSTAFLHMLKGFALDSEKQVKEAEAAFRQCIALDPKYAKAYCDLGEILMRQGKQAEAKEAFRQAIALDSKNAFIYMDFGDALIKEGNLAEAEAAYRQALELNPKNYWAHYALGVALIAQKKHAEAEAVSQQFILLDRSDSNAHKNLGYALMGQGKYLEAIAAFAQALRLLPQSAVASQGLTAALNMLEELIRTIQRTDGYSTYPS